MSRRPKDITGQKFRMLTALYPKEERGHNGTVVWHCRCDCGREVDVDYDALNNSGVISCGCRRKEDRTKMEKKLTRVGGTTIELISSSHPRVGSKAGVKGVSYCRSKDVYRAEIYFQGQRYRLGSYKNLSDAAAVRKQAEEELLEPFLTYYTEYKRIADGDPSWAKMNPIQTDVRHQGGGRFWISIKPDIRTEVERHQDTGNKQEAS